MNESQSERDGEEMAEKGDPTQTRKPGLHDVPQPRQGHAIPPVTTEPRDLIVPVWIGTNSNHLFLIY